MVLAVPKIAVLHYSPKPSWSSRRLLRALSDKGATSIYMLWSYLSSEIGQGCPVKYQNKCLDVDAIIVRGFGQGLTIEQYQFRIAVLRAAEDSGVLIVNPVEGIINARDKFTSLRILSSKGLPVPRTIVTENPSIALHFVEQVGDTVIKPIIGSLGLGSFRVSDVDTAYHVINVLLRANQPIYLQEYIEKESNMDLRVFVVGDEVVASMYRQATRGWKTNIARGAKPIPAHPREEIARAAIEATKALNLLYAGVDIIEAPNENFYVIEVNASPLWKGLQKATGIDPAQYIATMVIDLVKK